MGDLQFGALACLTPNLPTNRMESFSGHERQGYENATARSLLLRCRSRPPITGKGCHAIVRTLIAQHHQVGMQLLDRPLLLARLPAACRSICDSLSGLL